MKMVDILMIVASCFVWLIAVFVFQILYMAWYIILLSVLGLFIFLFIVYYVPLKKKYDETISTAQQTYLDNKDVIDEVYVSQLKDAWTNDVSGRNLYYLLMFAVFCYTPVLYYIFYLLYHDPKQPTSIDGFMNWFTLLKSFILLLLTAILMLLILLISTIGFTYLLLYISVPVVFLGGVWWTVTRHWLTLYTVFRLTIIGLLIGGGFIVGWNNLLYSIVAGIMMAMIAWGVFIQ